MGSLCQGLFGSSASTTYQPPDAVKNAITDILGRAATQSNQPYPQYTPDTAAQYSNYNAGLLAPMTPNQAQAGQSIAGLQGYTAPNFGAATNLVANSANPLQMQQFSQNSVNQYMNPYLNDVVGSAVSNINQTNAQQQQQALGSAIGQGAYGGDRAGIAQAELARQQGLANNATIANLLGQGYSQAQGQFNQQQQTDLATQLQNRTLMSNAGLNLANLGTQGQQAAIQQAQAQYGYGTAEQQQQQAGLSTAYQQYLNQQAFPYQQLSYYAGLASGAAPALGGTTTGSSPTISPYNAFSGLGVLGSLGGQSAANSGGFLSGLGSAASGVASGFGSLFGLKDGGRANYDNGGRTAYADSGAVPISPITQAYNDYNNAVAAGAPYDVLQQLYQKYQRSFQGGTPPWQDGVSAPVTTLTTTPTATSAATDTSGKTGGNGGGGNDSSVSPIYGENGNIVGRGSLSGPGASGGPTDEYGINPRAGDTPGFGTPGAGGGYGINQQKGILSGLIGGVDKTTGAQTGISGAFDALIHGNSPGTMNQVLNGSNRVAVDSNGNPVLRADGTPYPNTTSGMTLQEYADKFADGDTSKIQARMSDINGARQIDWFVGDKTPGILSGFSVPAEKLTESVNPMTTSNMPAPEQIDTSGITDPLAGGADLAGRKNASIITSGLVDPNTSGLLAAIQNQESGGFKNPNTAVGDGGAALGAFQMHNPAARQAASELGLQYDPSMRSNPEIAPQLAQQYLSDMFNYTGSVPGAIAAYQMGPGAYKAAVNAGQDPTQNAYAQSVLSTGLVNTDAGVMPPGPAPLPPSNPEYSKGLSEIQAGQNVPGVGAASEGHGGNDQTRDTSGDRTVYSSPIGPGLTDKIDSGEGGGESDHVAGVKEESQAEHNENRGGRIHKYADGGFTPFHMQYGLPSGSDIEQQAQDYAGSGAGVLAPQLEALAAKGVLPSAKGGRIHAQTGVGISEDNDGIAGNANLIPGYNDNSEEMWTPNPKEDSSSDDIFQRFSKALYPKGPLTMAVGQDAKYTLPDVGLRVGKENEPAITTEKTPINQADLDRAYEVGKTIQSRMGEGADAAAERKKAELAAAPTSATGTYTEPYEPRSASGTYTAPYDKTQPVTPKVAPKQVAEDQENQSQEQPKSKNVQVAQDQTRTMSDAAQPGFGYIAPPPMNRDQLARLMFFSAGARPGATLGDSGAAYANAMMAGQGQERALMEAQGRTAREYAGADLSTSQSAAARVTNVPGGYRVITSPGQAPLEMGKIPFSQLTGTQGEQIQSVAPIKGGTPQANQESILNRAAEAQLNSSVNNPGAEQTAKQLNEQAQADATVAQNATTGINQSIIALTGLPDTGPLTAGPYSDMRYNIFNTLNFMYHAKTGQDLDVGADALQSKQELDKLSTWGAQNLGRENAAIWKRALQLASPSAEMNKGTASDILSAQIVDNKRLRERGDIYNKYQQKTYGYGADAPQVFEQVKPSRQYEQDRQVISTLLKQPNSANAVRDYVKGDLPPGALNAYIRKITKNPNADIEQYFQ